MPQNTPSINKLKDLFYSLSVGNLMLHDFGFGPTYNIDTTTKKFPLMWVEPDVNQAVNQDNRIQVFTHTFNIYVMDKIKMGDENFDELLSDCSYIIQQIITMLYKHPIYKELDIAIEGSVNWYPVFEVEDSNLNGYKAEITLRVPNRFTVCNIPQQPILSYTASLNGNTVSYRLMGPQGAQGPAGSGEGGGGTGATGSQGPQGAQGAQGPQGAESNTNYFNIDGGTASTNFDFKVFRIDFGGEI